ncbi:MAG: TolC family protein, partial [Anaplasmataceae bacterium]|nr:TolC family protein [Anaplasmataceae bacterium]
NERSDLLITLENVIKNSPKFATNDFIRQGARNQLLGGYAKFLPNINISASHSDSESFNIINGTPSQVTSRSFNYTQFTFNQNIFAFGKDTMSLASLSHQDSAAKYATLTSENAVLFDALQVHLNLVIANQLVSLHSKRVQKMKLDLNASKRKKELEQITIKDLKSAEAKYYGALSDLYEAQGDAKKIRAKYIHFTSVEPELILKSNSYDSLEDYYKDVIKNISKLPQTLEEVKNYATKHSPTILNSMRNVISKHFASASSFANIFPSIDLNYMDKNEYESREVNLDNSSINLSVSIPLLNNGRDVLNYSNSNLAYRKAIIDNRETQSDIMDFINGAWDDIKVKFTKITAAEKKANAYQMVLDSTIKQRESNLSTILDVMSAENDYTEAKIIFYKSYSEYIIAIYELLFKIAPYNEILNF